MVDRNSLSHTSVIMKILQHPTILVAVAVATPQPHSLHRHAAAHHASTATAATTTISKGSSVH